MENITAIGPAEGSIFSVVGDTYRILVSGEQTKGAYSVIDMLVPPNGGPGPHAHPDYQEAFYVMEGELEIQTTEQTYTAGPGSYINIPRGGTIHQFGNKTNNTVHMLCILTPAGMEKMFEEIGEPVKAGEFMPPPEMTPEKIQKFKAIAEHYGQQLYPPDYFTRLS